MLQTEPVEQVPLLQLLEGLVDANLFVVVDFVGANDMITELKYCCLYMCCLGKNYISSLNYFLSCGLVQDDGICCNVVGP